MGTMLLVRNKKSIGNYCFKLLGSRVRLRFLSWLLEKRHHSSPVIFSGNNSGIKKLLLIVPEEPFDALLQIPTVMALCNHFRAKEVWLLCPTGITPYFRTIEGVNQVIEYNPDDRWLFTAGSRTVRSQIMREQFDTCLLLERNPDEALLFWCGSSGARLRAGYHGAAEFPFVNIQVKASTERSNRVQANRLLAEVFGCPKGVADHWVVAKQQLAEIRHMLGEFSLSAEKPLVGIEIDWLLTAFNKQWVLELVDAVRQAVGETGGIYLFSYQSPDKGVGGLIAASGLPCITNLAIAQIAALVASTGVVVAGPSLLLVMAGLLKKPAIGIVTADECALYCESVAHLHPVVYSNRPDDTVLSAVIAELTGLI